jgi:hypothetical protein
VELAIEELLHIAAVVEASERVADSLQAERFTQAKVGKRECDVFGDSGGEVAAAIKGAGVSFRVGKWIRRSVVLDGKRSDGIAVGDKRNTD